MPRNVEQKPSDLFGMSIYQDPKRGTIFYDFVSRKGYIITRRDVKTYNVYSTMFILCFLLAFGLMSIFELPISLTFGIALLLCVVNMVYFRYSFFYKLPMIENWKPFKKQDIFHILAEKYETPRLIALVVMLSLLAVLMFLYSKTVDMKGIDLIADYIVSAVTGIGALVFLIALIIKLKK